MTKDEIIAMAKDAGLLPDTSHPTTETRRMRPKAESVHRFAALVEAKAAEKEREACACFALINGKDAPTPEERDMAQAIAASIRARGKP